MNSRHTDTGKTRVGYSVTLPRGRNVQTRLAQFSFDPILQLSVDSKIGSAVSFQRDRRSEAPIVHAQKFCSGFRRAGAYHADA